MASDLDLRRVRKNTEDRANSHFSGKMDEQVLHACSYLTVQPDWK